MKTSVLGAGLAVVGIVVAVSACSSKSAELRALAASDLKCPEDSLEKQNVMQYVESMSGCSKENVYAYDHMAKKWVSPLDRAAYDLECPKDQIKVKRIDSRSVGTEGCGKKAVYVISQTLTQTMMGIVLQNSWVANVIQGSNGGDAKPKPDSGAPKPDDKAPGNVSNGE